MDNDQDTQTNEVMNGDEAAVFLKMPKSTLLKLCSEGQLPGVKVGRQWRFHRDALEKWKNEKAGEAVDISDESEGVSEPVPLDFSQNLRQAETRIEKEIKPVVEEVSSPVVSYDFETTGEVRILDDLDEGVGEAKEIEEAPVATATTTRSRKTSKTPKTPLAPQAEVQQQEAIEEVVTVSSEDDQPVKNTRKRSSSARSASALELMAQISEKTPARKTAGRTSRTKTSTTSSPARTRSSTAAAAAASIREQFDETVDDTSSSLASQAAEAVEISRPYNREAAKAPQPPQHPKRRGDGGGSGVFRKAIYWVAVVGVLVLAGFGVKSLLVPVASDSALLAATSSKATPQVPTLPEFQVVYKHNDSDEIGRDNLQIPTPPPRQQPAPVAQQTTDTVDRVIVPGMEQPAGAPGAPVTPVTAAVPPAPLQEGVQQPTTPIATAPAPNRNLESINRLLPALFDLSGCTITSNNNEIRIAFEEGIFSSGISVESKGKAQLTRVAEFLNTNASDFWVIIEGQTDGTPVRPQSPFRDNYTLGLRRAVAATEIMRNEAQFPADRLLASSAGGVSAPFPDAKKGSGKNRTVVLRLIPKAGS